MSVNIYHSIHCHVPGYFILSNIAVKSLQYHSSVLYTTYPNSLWFIPRVPIACGLYNVSQ